MNAYRWLALVMALFLFGCQGKPVDLDKKNFIGYWYGTGMSLLITADGNLSYERKKESVSTSINGPIQEFESDHITVGAWIFTTEFKINRAPYQDGDAWRMVIDDVTLTRQPEIAYPVKKPNTTPTTEA